MEKAVYKDNMLLNDSTKYERVTCNSLADLQRDTSDHLRRLYRNDYLKIKYHDYALTLTDTMLAKLNLTI